MCMPQRIEQLVAVEVWTAGCGRRQSGWIAVEDRIAGCCGERVAGLLPRFAWWLWKITLLVAAEDRSANCERGQSAGERTTAPLPS